MLKEYESFDPDQLDAFFGGNALRFLGLAPVNEDANGEWTKNRERLQAFYENNQIDPPKWFVDSR